MFLAQCGLHTAHPELLLGTLQGCSVAGIFRALIKPILLWDAAWDATIQLGPSHVIFSLWNHL